MTPIGIIVTLIIVALLLYVVRTLVPIDARIYNVIVLIVVVLAVLWLVGYVIGPGWWSQPLRR